MSYSFSLRASNKVAAIAAVAAELDKVVQLQRVHAVDQAQAQAAAESIINLLPDDDSKDVSVSMNGYVTGQWSGMELERLMSVAVSVSAGLTDRLSTAS